MSIHVSMWSYKYSLQGIFIPCIFHIFTLAKGFALSWICTDTVVIDTEIIKDIGIHSVLNLLTDNKGKGAVIKRGQIFPCIQYVYKYMYQNLGYIQWIIQHFQHVYFLSFYHCFWNNRIKGFNETKIIVFSIYHLLYSKQCLMYTKSVFYQKSLQVFTSVYFWFYAFFTTCRIMQYSEIMMLSA